MEIKWGDKTIGDICPADSCEGRLEFKEGDRFVYVRCDQNESHSRRATEEEEEAFYNNHPLLC